MLPFLRLESSSRSASLNGTVTCVCTVCSECQLCQSNIQKPVGRFHLFVHKQIQGRAIKKEAKSVPITHSPLTSMAQKRHEGKSLHGSTLSVRTEWYLVPSEQHAISVTQEGAFPAVAPVEIHQDCVWGPGSSQSHPVRVGVSQISRRVRFFTAAICPRQSEFQDRTPALT